MYYPGYVLGSFDLETQNLEFCDFLFLFFDNFPGYLFLGLYICYVVNLYGFSGFLSVVFSIFYQFFFDLLSERFPQLYLPNFY